VILLLLLIPFVAGITAFFIRHDFARRVILVSAALLHFCITVSFYFKRPGPLWDGWLMLDAPGLLFLSITSLLFLMASLYAVNYLRRDKQHRGDADTDDFFFKTKPEALFTACLLFFLTTMSIVTVTQHLGILWVAMEATTLASAPLIYYHRSHHSLEATWKYLLICSVGIALALLGNLLLVMACPMDVTGPIPLLINEFVANGTSLQPQWLRMAFIFFIVGYGTKMGLAPMHTWLPDAHSEAPSFVSALLSGALLNCAFLGILRIHQICIAAGEAAFSQELLRVFGMISIFFAAVFIIGQKDYKRMLAYSSVEHMGILALGVGIGGEAVFASMFHAVNHSLTKGMLFLVAGNILMAYGSRITDSVSGVLKRLTFSGILWIAGFFAITGTPPSGLFVSEFLILKTAFAEGRYVTSALYLILLAVIFAGMALVFLNMAQGDSKKHNHPENIFLRERLLSIIPPAILCLITFILGLYVPDFLNKMLTDVAKCFGG